MITMRDDVGLCDLKNGDVYSSYRFYILPVLQSERIRKSVAVPVESSFLLVSNSDLQSVRLSNSLTFQVQEDHQCQPSTGQHGRSAMNLQSTNRIQQQLSFQQVPYAPSVDCMGRPTSKTSGAACAGYCRGAGKGKRASGKPWPRSACNERVAQPQTACRDA